MPYTLYLPLIAYESGVTNTVDPLGGSYFIEKLTNDLEEDVQSIMKKIDEQGGMVEAVSKRWVQNQIQDAAFAYKKDVEEKKRLIVGVNCFETEENELPIEILKIDPVYEELQKKNLAEVRKRRDDLKVKDALGRLHEAATRSENIIPYFIEASRTYASIEEMMKACTTAGN